MTCPIDSAATTITIPAHGWTPERKAQFLDRLATNGNARAACRAVGLSAEAAYKLRRRDPLFARAWAAAILLGRENGIQALAERAIDGVEEQIYYRGELVGTRRRYDSRLLLAHLARLDQLADEEGAGEDAGRFDELLACVAGGRAPVPDRESFVQAAAENADRDMRERGMDAFYERNEEAAKRGFGEPASEEELEYVEALEDRCAAETDRARVNAGRQWDRMRAESLAAVDALLDAPRHGPDHAPNYASILAVPQPENAGVSLPRTLSTASTSALATALASAGQDQPSDPRSPISLAALKTPPRTPGGNAPLPAVAASGRRGPGKRARACRNR